MTKFLLFAAAAAVSVMAQAENQVYLGPKMAEARSASANGKYALFCNPDDFVPYLWSTDNPEEFATIVDDGMKFDAYGINNDGVIVGSVQITHSATHRVYMQPVVFENGKITRLPINIDAVDENGKAMTGNHNYAICISDNGRIIGGYMSSRPSVESMGQPWYPCIWEKKDDNSWELHLYNDIPIPDHQGFWTRTMYTDGTLEGTVLGGILNGGAGSQFPAIIKNGQLIYWHTIEPKVLPTEYKGDLLYFEEQIIDSYFRDGWKTDYFFEGGFYGSDRLGNFYGLNSSLVEPADGKWDTTEYHAEREMGAYVFNVLTGETEYYPKRNAGATSAFSTATDKGVRFNLKGNIIMGTEEKPVLTHFGLPSVAGFCGVSHTDSEGKLLVAQRSVYNEATGQPDPFPVVITLDEAAAVQGVEAAQAPVIRGLQGAIEVSGAETVAVYDLQGRYMGTGASLAPGIYVVKADQTTAKVIVK